VPFGKELQTEREQRDVSLETMALETKVSVRFLQALESDDFGSLPGGVFQRGMVGSYCLFLGLDEHEWLGRFTAEVQAQSGDQDWTTFAENVKRTRAPRGSSMSPRWWGVLLMLLALLGLSWLAWHYVVRPRMHLTAPAGPASAAVQGQ
jgi:cytoskeletal protein RodZ